MAETGDKGQQRWARVGKAFAGLAALVTVVLGAFAIYDRFASAASLTAKISSTTYRTPPQFVGEGDARKVDDEYKPRWELPPQYEGYFVVTIENTGGTQAENVIFTVPYYGVARIVSDSQPRREIEFRSSIDVGVIAPDQSIKIWLWTEDEAADFHQDEFRLRHSKGVADIIFLRETEGWWHETWDGITGLGTFLLFIAAFFAGTSLLVTWVSGGWKKKGPPTSNGDPNDEAP